MADELMIHALDPASGELVLRPTTDEERVEYEQLQTDAQAEQLRSTLLRSTEEIRELLASTDKWAARAVEEGVPMSPERIAYRQGLRALLGTVAKSDDPASVEIPAAPANPKAS